ncbi:MAG TPA: pyruvate kinase, partial [Pyrinomonadaceae bacterium]|nr:pyruvate kinase [Pyrinomonadaceae bacterium]
MRRTKIVATLGPASNSADVVRRLIGAGMDVARLNFSHGTHEEHARNIGILRAISKELDTPVTILQDLSGPKIRVGQLPGGEQTLSVGSTISLVPEADFAGREQAIPLDYPDLAESVKPGMRVLLDDGLLELEVIEVAGREVRCRVLEGGVLKSRKGVNFPQLSLPLPSLTEKDKRDLEFGLAQKVDWMSLSFVRSAADMRTLKQLLAAKGARMPVIAKIEKPQAIENIDGILREADGVMVARGDLGVEVSAEKVPMLQKQIIEKCNRLGLPVITATQMLESMIHEPRPTRAEASDVANAIIDGTDAVMLSGESAIGAFPVRAVDMMVRIASEVEARIEFKAYQSSDPTDVHALSQAATDIGKNVALRAIVVLTTTGDTARLVAAERSKVPLIALTTDPRAYHSLNLFWGIKPLLVEGVPSSFEGLVAHAEV